jgi:hypothetical protein
MRRSETIEAFHYPATRGDMVFGPHGATVTGSVESTFTTATGGLVGARGTGWLVPTVTPFWATGLCAGPVNSSLLQLPKPFKLWKSKTLPCQGPKMFNICMGLDLDMMNNFLHQHNCNFPMHLML